MVFGHFKSICNQISFSLSACTKRGLESAREDRNDEPSVQLPARISNEFLFFKSPTNWSAWFNYFEGWKPSSGFMFAYRVRVRRLRAGIPGRTDWKPVFLWLDTGGWFLRKRSCHRSFSGAWQQAMRDHCGKLFSVLPVLGEKFHSVG